MTSITLNGETGAQLVGESPQNREVAEILEEMRASAEHAKETIDSVRAMFSASGGDRGALDVNALVREAVDLMRLEIEMHRVVVEIDASPELPPIPGHRGQLLDDRDGAWRYCFSRAPLTARRRTAYRAAWFSDY